MSVLEEEARALPQAALSEETREERREKRIAARRERERLRRRRALLRSAPLLLCFLAVGVFALRQLGTAQAGTVAAAEEPRVQAAFSAPVQPESNLEPAPPSARFAAASQTLALTDEIDSQFAVVIRLDTGEILAQKEMDAVISPASMTKILTALTAAEHITQADLDKTVTIDFDITDYCYVNGCSVAGFLRDEEVPVRNLLYATILPSGADGALGLAKYVAGSQEAFVQLMNEKAEELGIADTAHFSNCVGIYDPENVCTVRDMAVILAAALDNPLSREALTRRTYDLPVSPAHPEGMVLSNWFIRRIEDHMPAGTQILAAKTGYVSQSGNCAASCAVAADGTAYLCVTGNTFSSWSCISDHMALYELFAAAQA